jgi:hypothetical protein
MKKTLTPILPQENSGKNKVLFGNYFQINLSKMLFQK